MQALVNGFMGPLCLDPTRFWTGLATLVNPPRALLRREETMVT